MDASHDNSARRPTSTWQCKACTFLNENDHGLACLMCQTERPLALLTQIQGNESGASQARSPPELERDTPGTDVEALAACGEDAGAALPSEREARLPVARRGDDVSKNPYLQQCDQPSSGEAAVKTSEDSEIAEDNRKANTNDDGGGKWDAFASLEDNYQSSDDDDNGGNDESDQDDDHCDNDRKESGRKYSTEEEEIANDTGGDQWDAFKSFEQNYESSEEEEFDSSSDEGSVESRDRDDTGNDDNYKEEGDVYPCFKKDNRKRSSVGQHPDVECVDLMDSDEDGSDCELEIVDTPAGKENNKTDKQSSRQNRSQNRKPYTLDGDSDSSLSEVESRRPLPSPSTRPLPSWRRRSTSSTPIVGNDDTLKSSDFFSCMSRRNDVVGGAGAGVNGFNLAKRKGEESGKKRKSRKSTSATATASSAASSSANSKKTTTKTKTRRKRRSTTSKASSTGKAPAKKRRKRSYKRKSTGRRSSTNSRAASAGGDAWSARERGVRQPYRRSGGGTRNSGGGSSAPYMNIAKQEPMLRNVGGASIQF